MTSLNGHYTVQCSLSGKKLCCRGMFMYLHWVFTYKNPSLSHIFLTCYPQTVFFSMKLLEEDVPVAWLCHNNIHDHLFIQLKCWLECRNLQVSGNKTTLVERYFKHIFILWITILLYGLKTNIVTFKSSIYYIKTPCNE